jgi:hypothetical protein
MLWPERTCNTNRQSGIKCSFTALSTNIFILALSNVVNVKAVRFINKDNFSRLWTLLNTKYKENLMNHSGKTQFIYRWYSRNHIFRLRGNNQIPKISTAMSSILSLHNMMKESYFKQTVKPHTLTANIQATLALNSQC